MMTIKAVIFDAFGTLVQINGQRKKPFNQLFGLLSKCGRQPLPSDARNLMTNNINIIGAANYFNLWSLNSAMPVPQMYEVLQNIENDLHSELMEIKLFPESIQVLNDIRDMGIKIGICSNLAAPYAVPVKALLPFELDSYSWSFDVGYIKPEWQIYKHACDQLQLEPHEVLFVGDSIDADITGPCKFGMGSVHINRVGSHPNDLTMVLDIIKKNKKCKNEHTPE